MGTLILGKPNMPAPPTLRPLDEPLRKPDCFSFGAAPLPLTLPFNFAVSQPTERQTPIFTFELVSKKPNPSLNPLKRRRRLTDVDGDGTAALLRKKRRLLKTLITSRLSRPFSYPATNIADRGTNKAALWARIRRTRSGMVAANLRIGVDGEQQQQAGPSEPMLRKAAILNRLRLVGLRSNNPKELMLSAAAAAPVQDQLRSQEPGEATRTTDEPFVETTEERIESPNMAATSSSPYSPLAPSPLGVSNYDALDLEDEWPDDDASFDDPDDDSQRAESIYSDFSVFDTNTADDDDDHCNTLGFSAMPH